MTAPVEQTRLQRLQAALEIAQRHGNSFMAANIRAAIAEERRRLEQGS